MSNAEKWETRNRQPSVGCDMNSSSATNEGGVMIKPNVLEKFGKRNGITDLSQAESIFRERFAGANQVRMNPKDIPPHLRHLKKGAIEYYADGLNPNIVYRVTTHGETTIIEDVLNFGTKNGRASY